MKRVITVAGGDPSSNLGVFELPLEGVEFQIVSVQFGITPPLGNTILPSLKIFQRGAQGAGLATASAAPCLATVFSVVAFGRNMPNFSTVGVIATTHTAPVPEHVVGTNERVAVVFADANIGGTVSSIIWTVEVYEKLT